MMRRGVLVHLILFCWMVSVSASIGQGRPLTIAAASSLYPAFEDLSEAYRKKSGGEIVFVPGASGNLARQMEHGAPYDLLLSADEGWIRYLAERNLLVPGSMVIYASGRLALVLSKHLPKKVWQEVLASNEQEKNSPPHKTVGRVELQMLKRKEIHFIALANPSHAPYGIAAMEVLKNAGLWEFLHGGLVYGENVRQAYSFVESGNAEVGLVAESVAKAGRLKWYSLNNGQSGILNQALGIASHGQKVAAKAFVSLLFAPEGQAILRKSGFEPVEKTPLGGKR